MVSRVVSDRFGMGFTTWSLMREVGVFDAGFWGCGRGKFERDAITDEGGGCGGAWRSGLKICTFRGGVW